jgi:hypothetical protein
VHPKHGCSECRREDLVSIKHRLRTLFLCLPLLLGAFSGMPMCPEEIEELMHSMNEQKIVVTVEDESENGDGTLPKLPDLGP